MSDGALRAVQFGVGPIGSRVVDVAADRKIGFVGAVDVDPAKVGRDLGRVAGLGRDLDATVTDDPATVLDAEPDIVFHTTASSLDAVADQLETAMAAGADVISTAEELSFPWRDRREAAEALNSAAIEHGVTCLGTGINPGFAMDTLPLVCTTVARDLESVRVERVQDTLHRAAGRSRRRSAPGRTKRRSRRRSPRVPGTWGSSSRSP